eukprot:SAG11_NODE_3098_length_2695_cov_1.971121_2_plen_140_part_00
MCPVLTVAAFSAGRSAANQPFTYMESGPDGELVSIQTKVPLHTGPLPPDDGGSESDEAGELSEGEDSYTASSSFRGSHSDVAPAQRDFAGAKPSAAELAAQSDTKRKFAGVSVRRSPSGARVDRGGALRESAVTSAQCS